MTKKQDAIPEAFWKVALVSKCYFRKSLENMPENIPDVLENGLRQLSELKGHSAENPLKGLGIHWFYELMRLFNYELELQSIVHMDDQIVIDEMQMKHAETNEKLILYNEVITAKEMENFQQIGKENKSE